VRTRRAGLRRVPLGDDLRRHLGVSLRCSRFPFTDWEEGALLLAHSDGGGRQAERPYDDLARLASEIFGAGGLRAGRATQVPGAARDRRALPRPTRRTECPLAR
jgi:hypothetical protein